MNIVILCFPDQAKHRTALHKCASSTQYSGLQGKFDNKLPLSRESCGRVDGSPDLEAYQHVNLPSWPLPNITKRHRRQSIFTQTQTTAITTNTVQVCQPSWS
eukprot:scpid73211/ scgid19424/ 